MNGHDMKSLVYEDSLNVVLGLTRNTCAEI